MYGTVIQVLSAVPGDIWSCDYCIWPVVNCILPYYDGRLWLSYGSEYDITKILCKLFIYKHIVTVGNTCLINNACFASGSDSGQCCAGQ